MTTELDVEPKVIGEILGYADPVATSGMALSIPEYQRPYAWTPDIALQLFDDLDEAVGPGGSRTIRSWSEVLNAIAPENNIPANQRPRYVIGSLILHQDPRKTNLRNVVDGQQRLLTLLMLKQALLESRRSPAPPTDPRTESPASAVRRALFDRVRNLNDADRRACWDVIAHRAEMVVITTTDLDEAFSIFDSQNTRGRGLDPHDLLKAFHLRQMQGASETERIATVERWEATDQHDLRQLFARYLYRIACWSRGESGRDFTEHDIDMFKGISSSGAHTPIQQYHAAAQAMIPAIQQWEATPVGEDAAAREHQLGHARFRLDEPIVAGSLFFEMVDFFLQELRRIRTEAVPEDWEMIFGTGKGPNTFKGAPGQSTKLYVSELYLAAMLYAVNRFGDDAIKSAGPLLRRWAFLPRVEMYAVREERIDNISSGAESVFRVMRHSQRIAKLLRHPVDIITGPPGSKNGETPQRLILREAGIAPGPESDAEEQNS